MLCGCPPPAQTRSRTHSLQFIAIHCNLTSIGSHTVQRCLCPPPVHWPARGVAPLPGRHEPRTRERTTFTANAYTQAHSVTHAHRRVPTAPTFAHTHIRQAPSSCLLALARARSRPSMDVVLHSPPWSQLSVPYLDHPMPAFRAIILAVNPALTRLLHWRHSTCPSRRNRHTRTSIACLAGS